MAARTIRSSDLGQPVPIYAVWETTLRCDHACAHCGSRADKPRETELSTEQLFEVADGLKRLGTREVTLIGGEAYLRGDVYKLTRYLADLGMRVTMQTGGRGLTADRCKKLKDAGMKAIGVSLDGPEDVHDRLRASPGSFQHAIAAMKHAKEAGLIVTSNMQVNRLSYRRLQETAGILQDVGVRVWRAQITVPMGRAADRPDWLLQPYMVLEVIDTLAAIQTEALENTRKAGRPVKESFDVRLGNNVGYFSPHEQLLRSRVGGLESHWRGCQAGRFTMGIESDGTIKGCPSLPTAPYTGGKVTEVSLEEIWKSSEEIAFVRQDRKDELWGHCKDCYYADICLAGCSFTSHCTLGKRGNNPFCYYRADKLRRQGVREVLVQKEKASGDPYDFGRFEIVEEPWSTTRSESVSEPSQRVTLPVL